MLGVFCALWGLVRSVSAGFGLVLRGGWGLVLVWPRVLCRFGVFWIFVLGQCAVGFGAGFVKPPHLIPLQTKVQTSTNQPNRLCALSLL